MLQRPTYFINVKPSYCLFVQTTDLRSQRANYILAVAVSTSNYHVSYRFIQADKVK